MTVMDSLMAFLQTLTGAPAYALLFGVLAASGFGLPVNEDMLLLAAAALTLQGIMQPAPLIAVAWCGLLVADTLIFHWGHRFGAPLLRHRHVARMLPPERLAAFQDRLRQHGPAWLFLVRFMPGLRSPLFFAAGSLKMRYRDLWLFDGLAAAIELPLLVYGVRYLGGRWQELVEGLQRFSWVVLLAIVFLAIGAWVFRRSRRREAPPSRPPT